MKDIRINTYSTWERSTSIFGVHTTPLLLLVEIKNNTNTNFEITGICISTKNNYFFFETSTDILHTNSNQIVKPHSKFEFKIDVRHIIENYSSTKNFTVKVISDNESYESLKISVSDLQNIQSIYN